MSTTDDVYGRLPDTLPASATLVYDGY